MHPAQPVQPAHPIEPAPSPVPSSSTPAGGAGAAYAAGAMAEGVCPRAAQPMDAGLPIISTTAPGGAAAIVAETELVEAVVRLRRMRHAALFGPSYDPEQYDAAIFAYRRARAASFQARRAWRDAVRALHVTTPTAA